MCCGCRVSTAFSCVRTPRSDVPAKGNGPEQPLHDGLAIAARPAALLGVGAPAGGAGGARRRLLGHVAGSSHLCQVSAPNWAWAKRCRGLQGTANYCHAVLCEGPEMCVRDSLCCAALSSLQPPLVRPPSSYYQQQGLYLQPTMGLGGQQCGGGSRCGAPDPARSPPTSADSSPKFTSGSPGSPGLDQYQGTGQAGGSQGQHGISLGASPGIPAPQRTLSGGGSGALSAAAFAAAAAAGGESGLSGHQLGAGSGIAPTLPQSTAALDWEREGGRAVVAAADVAVRSGNSSIHIGAPAAGTSTRIG